MQTIKQKLRRFKLAGIDQSIEERLAYAKEQKLSYSDFLELLLEDESNNRADNNYKRRHNQSKLPHSKCLEDFDFDFQPSIDKRLINDCLTCQFIREKKNIVFIGNPGTGKTHLSIGLARQVLKKGYKVLFTTAGFLLQELHGSKADNSYVKKLSFYLKPDLLVIDELGFRSIPSHSANDFFEVISRRYEQSSTIITTNKPFEQWNDIFSDPILTSAILDRIVHHAEVIKINGPSYRQKGLKKNKG